MIRTAREMVAANNSAKEIGITDLIAQRKGRPKGASERSSSRKDSYAKSDSGEK